MLRSKDVCFDGRAILVTGAGRGLGRTHALLLASQGAKIVVADNGVAMDGDDSSPGPAKSVAAEIAAAGGQAIPCTADLATETGANAAVAAVLEAFGRIDGILHNASTVPTPTPIEMLSSRDIDLVMRINAYAGLWMARAAWPHMIKQNYGRILFTTSAGIFGKEGNAAYSAAKAANIGIMRCLATEGAQHGIMVNAIAPSARTRMTEGFLASAYADWFFKTMPPEKVSVGAAYLMSEACKIYGETFSLGGGRIGRIRIAESKGMIGSGESIEEAGECISHALAETEFFYPKDLAERSARVAEVFGLVGDT